MSATTWKTLTIAAVECGACHMWFGLEASYLADVRLTGELFYCPAGHHIRYADNENQRLKDELAREKHRREQAQAEADRQRERVDQRDRSLVAVRGHHTRLKRRVAAGVCPCCNRSFQNLHRHMAGQHPNYPAATCGEAQ